MILSKRHGTPVGTTCSLLVFITAQAGATAKIAGTVTIPGPFCVSVYEVGNLTADVAYSVSVSHS